jgi:predicted AAA-ATPase
MKKFNTTGTCIPEKHFMVISDNKINKIMNMVENGEYFTINKPRQYGKTTTLYLIDRELKKKEDYFVIRISFEGMGDERFKSEKSFIEGFFLQLKRVFLLNKENEMLKLLKENKDISHMDEFGMFITELVMLSNKKVVLLIDEIDKNSDNQLFVNFLGLLRMKYLMQKEGVDYTFHSVILAGVHDVKNLKLKIRSDEERKYNSPWNIAVNFDIDMNFTKKEIENMLVQYSNEKKVKLDAEYFSEKLFYYTNGYPFFVSRLCELIDDEIMKDDLMWQKSYMEKAVKICISENNTNYESLIKNLENNKELYDLVYKLLIEGNKITYNIHNPIINLGIIYGVFIKEDTLVKVNNRIYEQVIYDYVISKIETSENISTYNFRENFLLQNGNIDFEKVLLKFQEFLKKNIALEMKNF